MKSEKCGVCQMPSLETTILLNGLKKRLIDKSLKQDQEYQQTKSDTKTSHIETFTKIVDLITFNPTHQINHCSHKKTYRDFYRKMRCSQIQFQQNCQQILLEIASKCFQLDVLVQQISSIQDRVLEIAKQKIPPSNLPNSEQKTQRRRLRNKKTIKRQVRNREHQQQAQINEQQNIRETNKNQKNKQKNEPSEKEAVNYDENERGLFYWPYILKNFGND